MERSANGSSFCAHVEDPTAAFHFLAREVGSAKPGVGLWVKEEVRVSERRGAQRLGDRGRLC